MKVDGERLAYFQDLYAGARSQLDEVYNRFADWYARYRGTNRITGGMDAKIVRNIIYELIEAQVDTQIPQPHVEAEVWNEANNRNAKSIEELCRKIRDEQATEYENDLDERKTYIYGSDIWMIDWDENERSHAEIGSVRFRTIAPEDFTPQPGVYSMDDMEYCFVRYVITKDDAMRKYGVSEEQLFLADSAEDDGTGDTVRVIVCFWRDDKRNVCQYIWSGDAELSSIDNYYARKRYVCRTCGRRKEECRDDPCEHPSYERMDDDYETLTEDIYLADGRVIPANSPVMQNGQPVTEEVPQVETDINGEPVVDYSSGIPVPRMVMVPQVKMEPTRLPYYRPRHLPVIVRLNTSKDKSLFGQSDVEMIMGLQEEINKVETRIHDKIMKSGIAGFLPEDAETGEISNGIFDTVYKLKPGQGKEQYGSVEYQANLLYDVQQSERLYDMAKRILGITDSMMGQADTTAKSGYAKSIQVAQSNGRLKSKRVMKNALYADIDRRIFELYLAFADEPRPLAYKDADGKVQNANFNRYDFYEYDDKTGEWYVEDRYRFSADTGTFDEADRVTLWNAVQTDYQSGLYGQPGEPHTLKRLWQMRERLHYPNARELVENFTDICNQLDAAQGMQASGGMSPAGTPAAGIGGDTPATPADQVMETLAAANA